MGNSIGWFLAVDLNHWTFAVSLGVGGLQGVYCGENDISINIEINLSVVVVNLFVSFIWGVRQAE